MPQPPLRFALPSLIALALLTSLSGQANAARHRAPTPDKPWPAPVPLKIERFQLDNGMRVVVQTDTRAPLVAMGLMVNVGSRDETKNRSGLAHFFEHMMFQGSKRVGKMEHFRALEAVGASLNANTSTDRTYYHEVVPKGALELAMWMEADRFATLKINLANVENQRQTVMEEKRQSYGNTPYQLSNIRLHELAFTTSALQHSTIGSMADLKATPMKDFDGFWRKWYTPNNIVLTLVGDIDLARAKMLTTKYFGRLKRRAEPKHASFSEPEPTQHVYATFNETLGKMPAFHLAWRLPARPHPDAYAIEMLAEVLDGGEASRLTRKLARETGLASRHYAGNYGRRDVDLFHVFVELSSKKEAGIERAKQIVRGAIYDIAAHGVSADELHRARISYEASWVFGNLSFSRRAAMLARYELYEGDANRVNGDLQRYRAVQSDDLKRVARRYLLYDREVELDVVPKGSAAPPHTDKEPKWLSKMKKGLEKAKQKEIKTAEKKRKALEKAQRREAKKRAREEAKKAKREAMKAKREAKKAEREAKKAEREAKKAEREAKKAEREAKRVQKAQEEARKKVPTEAKRAEDAQRAKEAKTSEGGAR